MPVRVQTGASTSARNRGVARRRRPRGRGRRVHIGLVRDINDAGCVSTLTLEHYPGMTEKALARIVDEAKSRWNVYDALVIHRVGE